VNKKASLSIRVSLDDVRKDKEVVLNIQATAEECAALAKRFKILEVKNLSAHIEITPGLRNDLFDVMGTLTANAIQECSVTLVPVKEAIEESFTEMLTTSPQAMHESDKDDDDQRPIEVLEGDTIDIGEIVAQWLGLSLDPYPRSDAPTFTHIEAELDNPTHKPFEVLENLKGK
jgi:uncharacterized metal-binding protein YceD (DUF177 family)